MLKSLLAGLPKDDGHVPADNSVIKWFDLAITFIGMNEIVNGKVNPLVTEFFGYTNYKTKANEPWCAAFICAMLAKSGYGNPATAAAVGFSKYGAASDYKQGAIIVIKHPSGSHHVTMFDSWVDEKNKTAKCLGGNQNNQVKYSNYDFKSEKVLAVRWPVVAKESTI